MTSRERILMSLQHKEPDRIPGDLGGTESSGITAFALHKLNTFLKIQGKLKIFEPYQYVVYIEDHVKRNIDTLAPGGGFVFCQVHNIQPDVPPENIVAMYHALDKFGKY